MLSVLIVAEHNDWHKYKELEECLLNDYHVDYIDKLSPDVAEISRIEFSYEIIFYLKQPTTNEIAAISRLIKGKVFIFLAQMGGYVPHVNSKLIPATNKIVLNAVGMRGKLDYYVGVDKIVAFDACHIEPKDCEVVLNGNKDTKAMLGDVIFRTGKSVVFAIRKDNLAIFSANIFLNEAMKEGDNCRFIRNFIKSMIGSAEFY